MIKYVHYRLYILLLVIWAPVVFAQPKLIYEIKGIEGPVLDNVDTRLKLNLPPQDKLSAETIKLFQEEAPEQIRLAVEPFGYFKSKISESLKREGNQWILHYRVKLGPQVTISRIDFKITGPGKGHRGFSRLEHRFPLKVGDPFISMEYEDAKKSLLYTAEQQGYLRGNYTKSTVRLNLQNDTAEIVLHFDTGKRFYFGNVTWSETPMDQDFLDRYLTFKPGDPLKHNDLERLQQGLSSTPYFKQVLVQPQFEDEVNQVVPVDIQLGMAKAHQYRFGLGYSTDTSERLSFGWDWRRVTPTGHYLKTDLRLTGSAQNSASINYYIPGKDPVSDLYNLNAGYTEDKPPDSLSRTWYVGVSYIQGLRHHWKRTLALTFQSSHFEVDEDDPDDEDSILLMPSVTWLRIKSDNRVFPSRGHLASFGVRGAARGLLSDSGFVQINPKIKVVRTLKLKNRFVFRAELGYTIVDNFSQLPLEQRFFAGGSQSIRGYGFRELGPGKQLVVGSAEYQYNFYSKFYGVLFYDVGNAYDSFDEDLKQGVGFGVMYASPVGPLELTLGQPISKGDAGPRIQFTMGPELL